MRPSTLTRSAIALASLALGSTVLAAAPATAATPSGITRDLVLTAANEMHQAYPPNSPGLKAIVAIFNRGCNVDFDNGEFVIPDSVQAIPMTAGSSADGLIAFATIYNAFESSARDCRVGVVAATSPDRNLSGTATLTVTINGVPSTTTTPLSGDVTATMPISAAPGNFSGLPAFSASGSAVKTTAVKTTTKVKDKKTKAEKKKAKKTYTQRLKAAKKSYQKALKKAGSSKSKKSAAKRTYSAKRSSAKTTYRYAIANYKIVTRTTQQTDSSPFAISLLLF